MIYRTILSVNCDTTIFRHHIIIQLFQETFKLNLIILNKSNSYATGQAYWEKALTLEKTGKKETAIQTLKDFLLTISHHPIEAKAYWQLANYHAEMNDYSSAAKFLEKILQFYGYTEFQDARQPR